MTISGINLDFRQIENIKPNQETEKTQIKPAGKDKTFGEMFENAIRDVNQLQVDADQKIEGLMLGQSGVTTHEAMIALEKADIAFQLMNDIRGKIIRAYQEVMRTQF